MKILLLQDEIYLPSLGGGIKANRLLLEGLADNGHECQALSRALTRSRDGPNNRQQFMECMSARGLNVVSGPNDVFTYEHGGVRVQASDQATIADRLKHVMSQIQNFDPDWILVADDKRRFMLEAAMRMTPDRVVPLVQTIIQLPFGPLSVDRSRQQLEYMRQSRAIIVISDFLKRYVEVHSGLESRVLHLPVYGSGPFADLGRFDSGFVTMVNPCELKGLRIFLALAREYAEVEFAAVPTWGADQRVFQELEALANVTLLEPADDIEEILAQTRVLLVPSLWPETFGYVVPEAMLRGIPVLASDIGGLPEAKLGVDYLLPVTPAERRGNEYMSPPQRTEPWSRALKELLSDPEQYHAISRKSRAAALEFVSAASTSSFESYLRQLAEGSM